MKDEKQAAMNAAEEYYDTQCVPDSCECRICHVVSAYLAGHAARDAEVEQLRSEVEGLQAYARHLQTELGDSIEYQQKLKAIADAAERSLPGAPWSADQVRLAQALDAWKSAGGGK